MKKTIKAKSVRARTKDWLIGLRLDGTNPAPTYYTLLVGQDQKPLVQSGQLVLSDLPHLLCRAKNLDECVGETLWEPDMICDLAEALYLIENAQRDESAVILNCLNLLFDLAAASQGTLPSAYKARLFDLADHLTFSRSLTAFFEGSAEQSRSDILDGVLWCIGWIMTHAQFLHDTPAIQA